MTLSSGKSTSTPSAIMPCTDSITPVVQMLPPPQPDRVDAHGSRPSSSSVSRGPARRSRDRRARRPSRSPIFLPSSAPCSSRVRARNSRPVGRADERVEYRRLSALREVFGRDVVGGEEDGVVRAGDARRATLPAPAAAREREHRVVVFGGLDARGLRDGVRVLALGVRVGGASTMLSSSLRPWMPPQRSLIDLDERLGLVGRVADGDREAEALEVLERHADVRDRDRVRGDAVVGRLGRCPPAPRSPARRSSRAWRSDSSDRLPAR